MDLAIPPDLSDPPKGVKVITEILEGDVVTDRAGVTKKTESWVDVAQDKKSLKKQVGNSR